MAEEQNCLYCGNSEHVALHEVWGRDFFIDTCCEGMHEAVVDELQNGSSATWVRELFEDNGIECRSVAADVEAQHLIIDFGLSLHPIDLRSAKTFINEHHTHHVASLGWKWGHAVLNGADTVAVCMVGRPVARMINADTNVEVTRLCARRDVCKDLTWNACSMLYAAAAREARRRGYEKIITYILEEEPGTSLRAAGWRQDGMTRGGSWNRPSRTREDKAPTGRKWRYCKELL